MMSFSAELASAITESKAKPKPDKEVAAMTSKIKQLRTKAAAAEKRGFASAAKMYAQAADELDKAVAVRRQSLAVR